MFDTILITGASSGIGEGFARFYAAPGKTLFLSGRNEERLAAVADACRAAGAEVHAVAVDVCDQSAMTRMIQSRTKDCPNGLDLVIANAGISAGFSGENPDDTAQDYRVFETNLTGVLNTVLPALPGMIERKKGHIVFISSLASFVPLPSAPAYSASKVAVRYYAEALSSRLKPHGVTVSVVCPGFIKSRMTDANDFTMPFLMETEQAVRYMAKKISQKSFRIDFPFGLAFPLRLLSFLPARLTCAVLSYLPHKKSLPK